MTNSKRTSRIPGLYRLSVPARRRRVEASAGFAEGHLDALDPGLTLEMAEELVENVIGLYALPMGLATNFLIDGRDVVVPMVIEEPSVIAAASNAAKSVRAGGGFVTESDPPLMIGQIEIRDVTDRAAAESALLEARRKLIAETNTHLPRMTELGGGCTDIEVRRLDDTSQLVVHLLIDCRDAMGANLVNTACEAMAPEIAELCGGRFGLRILSNLADRRLARASCRVPPAALERPGTGGEAVAQGIAAASRFAEADPYRAATHNKGIMNGIDAVVLATGNDWRGVEAGAHAFAARSGRYMPLSRWQVAVDDGWLEGHIELPLAVGTVGGATRVHPGAGLACRMLGVETAGELARILAAVGLAQNMAAIAALAAEGIQAGHMALHNRSRHLADDEDKPPYPA